eukprot:9955404-Karenia_brevis.AAC.2
MKDVLVCNVTSSPARRVISKLLHCIPFRDRLTERLQLPAKTSRNLLAPKILKLRGCSKG